MCNMVAFAWVEVCYLLRLQFVTALFTVSRTVTGHGFTSMHNFVQIALATFNGGELFCRVVLAGSRVVGLRRAMFKFGLGKKVSRREIEIDTL
jgi:hypothetical protein